jgi:hypothetical protein
MLAANKRKIVLISVVNIYRNISEESLNFLQTVEVSF